MIQIVFKQSDWGQLTEHLTGTYIVESGAYAVFSTSGSPDKLKLLVNRLFVPQQTDYLKRTATSVAFAPEFTERVFQECEHKGQHFLDIHTHPWSERVAFSGIDDREAVKTKVPYLAEYLPQTQIAFIVFGAAQHIARARIWDNGRGAMVSIDRILVI